MIEISIYYINNVDANLIFFSMGMHAGIWCFMARDHRCFVSDEG